MGDKAGLYHITHEKVAYPFGVLAVSLIAFLRFGALWVGKGNKTGFFKDVKNRDPILTQRFQTDFQTVVFSKPVRQLPQSFGEKRKASLLIVGTTVCIGDSDASIDPGFVDVKSTKTEPSRNKMDPIK